MAYKLILTEADVKTIRHIGWTAYSWSAALYGFEAGEHVIPEHEAWELREAFEADTEGGHAYFPCLDHKTSGLATRLFRFMNSIV